MPQYIASQVTFVAPVYSHAPDQPWCRRISRQLRRRWIQAGVARLSINQKEGAALGSSIGALVGPAIAVKGGAMLAGKIAKSREAARARRQQRAQQKELTAQQMLHHFAAVAGAGGPAPPRGPPEAFLVEEVGASTAKHLAAASRKEAHVPEPAPKPEAADTSAEARARARWEERLRTNMVKTSQGAASRSPKQLKEAEEAQHRS